MPLQSDSISDIRSYELPRGFDAAADSCVSTVIVDSIARDTVSGRIPHFIPVEKADSMRVEAFIDSIGRENTLAEAPSGSSEGLVPTLRRAPVEGEGALTGLFAATLVLLAFNASSVFRALRRYRHELWSVRKRPNVFDDDTAASVPVATLLALVFVVFGGAVLYYVPGMPPSPSFAGMAASMALMGLYYAFQYSAYSLVGYAFAPDSGRRRWLAGFNASQAYTGLFLIIPALLLVYMPQWRDWLVIFSLTVYFAGRALFIIKGFRIFYCNFRSLLYFILYLCSLEIIPLLAVYALSVYLWSYMA